MAGLTSDRFSIVMIGATGAVGTETVRALVAIEGFEKLTLLGRQPFKAVEDQRIDQHVIDVFKPDSYSDLLEGHRTAICTMGVGQPSKISKEDFVKIDKLAVLNFARTCKASGVRHFQLLGSVGADAMSRSFFLRTKGELEDELRGLAFERLSLFHPSMILTPTNRYGLSQAVTLAIWPALSKLMVGGLSKFRGIPVEELGTSIAKNVGTQKSGVETLEWNEIKALVVANG